MLKKNEIKTNDIKDDSKDVLKKYSLIIKIVVAVVTLFLIMLCGKYGYEKLKDHNSISGVRRLLKAKYSSITCINPDCDGFIVVDGDILSKHKILLYDKDGKKVASYKEEYKNGKSAVELPLELADNFYISSTIDTKDSLDSINYAIKDKRGKTIYETKNELNIINDNLIVMNGDKTLTLLDKKGKVLYDNISDIDVFVEGKYINIKIDDNYTVLDRKGKELIDGYEISKIVKDESDKEVFAIIKNSKDNIYYFYDLDKEKIIGDGFNSYEEDDNLKFIITKKENEKTAKYILKENGKQKKLDVIEDEIKDNIDENTYKLYTESIYKSNQKYVLVDNIKDKSFGVLDIKNNEYIDIYKYKSNKYINSNISKLMSYNGDDYFFKIMCSDYYCEDNNTIIYDLKKLNILYKSNSKITNYLEYENGYKVIKFYEDDKYGSKYVVFDENNNNLSQTSSNAIIVDKKLIIGSQPSTSLSLYSVKKGKVLNKESASTIKIEEDKIYKYKDNNYNVILNSIGEEVIKVNEDNYQKQVGDSYIYINDNKLNIYNVQKDRTYKYKLKPNERLNNISGKVISPYRNIIFLNNGTDNYLKVINFKGRQIKKINKSQISSVNINQSNKKAYIIVKEKSKKKDSYGLYVAE